MAQLSFSMWCYLSAIDRFAGRGEPVRQAELARALEVSKASVCRAVKRLQAKGLVQPGLLLLPTPAGRRAAEQNACARYPFCRSQL